MFGGGGRLIQEEARTLAAKPVVAVHCNSAVAEALGKCRDGWRAGES